MVEGLSISSTIPQCQYITAFPVRVCHSEQLYTSNNYGGFFLKRLEELNFIDFMPFEKEFLEK